MKMALIQGKLLYLNHMARFAPKLSAILSLFALAAVAFSQQNPPTTTPPPPSASTAPALDAKTKQEVLDGLQQVITTRAFVPGVDFSKWPDFLATHRADIDKSDTDIAFVREANKVLKQFGVSHIALRTPRSATARRTGTASGLGMLVRKTDAGLEVTTVFPQGPAGQAGIEAGDIVKEVEGKPAEDPAAIRIDLGKSVDVKVLKKSGETKDFKLENKEFSNRRPETLTWIAKDAAVLRIWTFAAGYDYKNVESLMQQADAKAKYLIVDLRSNGGGLVTNLNHFLSMLIPDQTPVGTFVSRTIVDSYAKDHTANLTDPVAIAAWAPRKFKTSKREDVEPFTGQIAVLVNRGSASASEIAGAALKECRNAALVGQDSMGAVLASVYDDQLPDGYELQYPVQDYVTIKGERLEGHPRVPDLKVEFDPKAADDTAQKALDFLKKRESEHLNSPISTTGHD